MDKLSSKYLYHYKRDIGIVKEILKNGFRHNLWEEKIVFRNSIQLNFIVCFCDILADQADYHRKCYGDLALVMSKEWGIKNNISPVRYVHSNSIGQLSDYMTLKNINREIIDQCNESNNQNQYIYDFLAISIAKDKGMITQPSIFHSLQNNKDLSSFFDEFDEEFKNFEDFLVKNGNNKIFNKYFISIGNRLLELYNELEKRDAFIRIYQDDFNSPSTGYLIKNKVLYDEREWRSVKFYDNKYFQDNPIEYQEALNNKYLSKYFNLKFTNDDLIAILVTNTNQVSELLDFVNSNTLIDGIETDKIKLFSDFNE